MACEDAGIAACGTPRAGTVQAPPGETGREGVADAGLGWSLPWEAAPLANPRLDPMAQGTTARGA